MRDSANCGGGGYSPLAFFFVDMVRFNFSPEPIFAATSSGRPPMASWSMRLGGSCDSSAALQIFPLTISSLTLTGWGVCECSPLSVQFLSLSYSNCGAQPSFETFHFTAPPRNRCLSRFIFLLNKSIISKFIFTMARNYNLHDGLTSK